MFNDRYKLTQAVLEGTKTMTRRVVPQSLLDKYDAWYEDFLYKQIGLEEYLSVEEYVLNFTAYNIGEIVAIAQSYHTLNKSGYTAPEWLDHVCESSAGYENKMFVRADLMPHHIKITDVKVERLQDISDEDCLREGLKFRYVNMNFGNTLTREDYYYDYLDKYGEINCYGTSSPRKTFSMFIDKICGYDTWESNPLVVAYSFELVD